MSLSSCALFLCFEHTHSGKPDELPRTSTASYSSLLDPPTPPPRPPIPPPLPTSACPVPSGAGFGGVPGGDGDPLYKEPVSSASKQPAITGTGVPVRAATAVATAGVTDDDYLVPPARNGGEAAVRPPTTPPGV